MIIFTNNDVLLVTKRMHTYYPQHAVSYSNNAEKNWIYHIPSTQHLVGLARCTKQIDCTHAVHTTYLNILTNLRYARAQSSRVWAIINAADVATMAVCQLTDAPDESVSDEGDKKLMAVVFCSLSLSLPCKKKSVSTEIRRTPVPASKSSSSRFSQTICGDRAGTK